MSSGGGGSAQQQEGQIRQREEVPVRGLSRPQPVCRGSHTEPSSGADDGGHKDRPADGVQDGRRALERGNTGTSHLVTTRTWPSLEFASQGVVAAHSILMGGGADVFGDIRQTLHQL